MTTPTLRECEQWKIRPNYDPHTGNVITIDAPEYDYWQKSCQALGVSLYHKKLSMMRMASKSERKKIGKNQTYTCQQLNDILTAICTTQLTQDIYHDFNKYSGAFLRGFLTQNYGCYGGQIVFFLRKPNYETRLAFINLNLDACNGRSLIIISVDYLSGPYDWKQGDYWKQQTQFDKQNISKAHAMMLLIDTAARTFELFEPNGNKARWISAIISGLSKVFQAKPEFIGYTFISPDYYCPRIGWQGISKDRMCVYWSLLYAVLRTSCPQIPREDLVSMLLGHGQEYLQNLLMQWNCYLWQYVREHHIIDAVDLMEHLNAYPFFREDVKPLYNTGQYTELLSRTKSFAESQIKPQFDWINQALANVATAYGPLWNPQLITSLSPLQEALSTSWNQGDYIKFLKLFPQYSQLYDQLFELSQKVTHILTTTNEM